MKVEIRALETSYRGVRFRSRTEARWAIFLDSIGQRWRYEEQGFSLNGNAFLPDFWLPDLDSWLEIKGTIPTRDEQELAAMLAAGTHRPVYLAHGGLLDNLKGIGGTMHRYAPGTGEADPGYRFAESPQGIVIEKAGDTPPPRLIESAYHIAAARRMWTPATE